MDSKQKFTTKVADYVKYRPQYPQEFIGYLFEEIGFNRHAEVADIGAGTGILTQQLLNKGVGKMFAIEPNDSMRNQCLKACHSFLELELMNTSAEDTQLGDESLDYITVGQAFHWFDQVKVKVEFSRILKPEGQVVLVWNSKVNESEIVMANHQICETFCPDFKGFSGGQEEEQERFADFFYQGIYEHRVFDNHRSLDLEAFIGSNLSASYAPNESDGHYQAFVDALTQLFNRLAVKGIVQVPMITRSYVGKLKGSVTL